MLQFAPFGKKRRLFITGKTCYTFLNEKVKFERSFFQTVFCGFRDFSNPESHSSTGKEGFRKAKAMVIKMEQKLMERLRMVTEEERALLAGGGVERERYATGSGFTVDREKLLEKGKLITMRPHTRFTRFPRHSHNYVEIMYMCSGQTVHSVDGAPPLTLRQGELLFLNQHAVHSVERADLEDIGVNLIVLPQFFDLAFEMIGADNILGKFLIGSLRRGGEEISYLHFRVADALPVQNLMENLVWSLVNAQPNSRRINQTTMGLLFLQLLNYTADISLENNAFSGHGIVLDVLREIEENYRTADLTAFARDRRFSLPYLSNAVHEATGRTFKELLREKRLTKAAELMCSTRLPVQDIITAVGYENTSYFYRIFRERYGMTPREYRRR